MITKTQAICNEFRNHWSVQKQQLRYKLNRKLEALTVQLVHWLINQRPVQRVIADAFNGSTPMCDVLKHAIENGMEDYGGIKVDADEVEGLEKYCEEAIDSAFNDRSFTDAVKEAIDLDDLMESLDLDELAEKVSERVVDELVRKLTR